MAEQLYEQNFPHMSPVWTRIFNFVAERAEGSSADRDLHRAVAFGSIGVATVGYLSMLDLFRRD